ncbi:MAG: LPD7 domain-containing protein [Pigmentiphaga sp.]
MPVATTPELNETQQSLRPSPGIVQGTSDTPPARKLLAPDPAQLADALKGYQVQRERARAEWAWLVIFGGGAREHTTYTHKDGPQKGRIAVVDTGRRILSMDDSRETVIAALRLAADRHGLPIKIAGGRCFNTLAAGLAGEIGIPIKNASQHAQVAWLAGQKRSQKQEQDQQREAEGLSL